MGLGEAVTGIESVGGAADQNTEPLGCADLIRLLQDAPHDGVAKAAALMLGQEIEVLDHPVAVSRWINCDATGAA